MVDRATQDVIDYFNRKIKSQTMNEHELMQAGRGVPKRDPVPGCPECDGTGIMKHDGDKIFCSCVYEEHEL